MVGMLTSYDVVQYMAKLEAGHFEQVLKLSTRPASGL
jgi:hypothetical protein